MYLIVAVDEDWGIGKNNDLLCHLPDDMKYFKKRTTGHTVIMGRKTLESFPGGNPLKNRTNIVLSSNEIDKDVVLCHSVDEVLKKCDDDAFVIGGGSIYKQFLPYCNVAYITKIHKDFDADTFFPVIDETDWVLCEKSEVLNNNGIDFHFEVWLRKL